MMQTYLPVALVILFALGFAVSAIILSHFIGKKKPNPAKFEPYECGIPPVGDARIKFSVKFYPLALLFLLFDIETIFILIWAYVFKTPGLDWFLFIEMGIFILILMVGYIYAWKIGVFDWRERL